MPGKRHSEEQILYALRQIEGGKKVSEVCREMGVSQQAVYSWKRRLRDWDCTNCGSSDNYAKKIAS